MANLIDFIDVSLYPDKPFGLDKINFVVKRGKKQLVHVSNSEKLNTLLGILENRYQPQSGLIRKFGKCFVQSDRLIMGDRVYPQIVGKWLGLSADSFYFEGRRRSKFGFIGQLKAKSILHLPLYKLTEEQKIKATLLAFIFQGSGLILISRLLEIELPPLLDGIFQRILVGTNLTTVVVTTENTITSRLEHLNSYRQIYLLDNSNSLGLDSSNISHSTNSDHPIP
jgi:hypothetical protein